MEDTRPAWPSGPAKGMSLERLLADLPPALDVGTNIDQVRAGRRLVVLDDDPTGTQSIADLPVLTRWSVADLRWALQQPTTAFFVLTNTRSLAADDVVERNQQIVAALDEAARLEGVRYVIASRSDSTLRGHYPLETDVLAAELVNRGMSVDGVLICPAYIEPGRITIDSVHWARVGEDMVPVADSEFARDASFGYQSSDLRDWVAEKTGGRIARADVARITLNDIRVGGPDRVAEILSGLQGGQPVVLDTTSDADLQVVVLALLRAEAAGKSFIYRTGPSFVRARSGQLATRAITADRLRTIFGGQSESSDGRPRTDRGLIVVGSHVGLSTRQLDRLRDTGDIIELELDVSVLLSGDTAHPSAIAAEAARLLQSNATDSDIVIRTSRTLVKGADAHDSLVIARRVSEALVGTARDIVNQVRPAFVVAKGGITSSDMATEGLSIRRAWSRGTLLPGIVSVWEPVAGPAQGIPYIVFAGNVGDDDALAAVVSTLRTSLTPSVPRGGTEPERQ